MNSIQAKHAGRPSPTVSPDCEPNAPAARSNSHRKLALLALLVAQGSNTGCWPVGMAHEIAKLLLEYAGTFLERTEAIKTALSLGMPLNQIEEYLDWLDATRPLPSSNDAAKQSPPADSPQA